MLTAYWDLELKTKDLPTDDPRVPTFPLEGRDLAESILAKAKIARPKLLGRSTAWWLLHRAREMLAYRRKPRY
jgi:hypothetical protein